MKLILWIILKIKKKNNEIEINDSLIDDEINNSKNDIITKVIILKKIKNF